MREGDTDGGRVDKVLFQDTIWNGSDEIVVFQVCSEFKYSGQFIGRPQMFVELQLCFKLRFYTRKMQFET